MGSTFAVNTREIERYAAFLQGMRANTIHVAHRMMKNNMAFGVRKEALEYIPKIMIVRNKRFLASTLLVAKARSGTDRALLYQTSRARFGGMREQEFGGTLSRQVITLAARGKNKQKQARKKARLIGGIPQPKDISVRGEKSHDHRVHVFLSMLQRKTGKLGGPHKGAFIVRKTGKFSGGLMKLGKIKRAHGDARKVRKRKDQPNRHFITLQKFEKGKKRIKRLRWLRPSIDKYLRRTDPAMEWRKVMQLLISRNRFK